MQVLPEGEPTVLPRQSDAKEAGCLSVKQVVAERAAQQSRLRSASCTFEADLPLLLQGPESRIYIPPWKLLSIFVYINPKRILKILFFIKVLRGV